MSYCPKCGAEVQDDAAFCSTCGAPLHGSTPAQSEPKGSSGNDPLSRVLLVVGMISAVVIVVGLLNDAGFGGSRSPSSAPSALETANIEVNCQDLVKKHLVSPGSMKVPSNSRAQRLYDGSWVYDFAVDGQNSFGALLSTAWHCEVHGDQVTVHQTQ